MLNLGRERIPLAMYNTSKRVFEQHGPVRQGKEKKNTNKLVYFRKFVPRQCISFTH